MFHDDGASTDVTGILVSSRARITAVNGSRTSPEKEKPVFVSPKVGVGWKRKGFTEDGVDDVVCFFESTGEILREWNGEVAELSC